MSNNHTYLTALLVIHDGMLEQNPYAYFELAYTRQTEWMAWICSKPATEVIAKGQGSTPEDACRKALESIGASK